MSSHKNVLFKNIYITNLTSKWILIWIPCILNMCDEQADISIMPSELLYTSCEAGECSGIFLVRVMMK